jgi:NDP-sugar pyrophosphorylase family protein
MDLSYFFSTNSFLESFKVSYPWEVVQKLPIHLKNLNLGKIEVKIPEGVFLEHPELISIQEGTVIERGAYIKGPCFIGKNCQIRSGAYLRGGVWVGEGAVVGHGTEIKNSILLERAHAAHFNYVGDSILGVDSNLGAGVKCANFRLDGKEISVQLDQKKIKTGLVKLGLILGDGSQIGCNSVTSPGTLIGKEVFCYPCIHIKGWIPSNSTYKNTRG